MSDLPASEVGEPTLLQFDDNSLLPMLFGEHDQHLSRIERQLGVSLVSRGNRLAISGPPDAAHTAKLALDALYARLKEKGVPEDLLPTIHLPAGLPIGAATMEEIALSVIAEIIEIRHIRI